jgi:hypothetical protein
MMIAVSQGDNGRRVILMGVVRGNIDRLTAGQPIRASAESHPGFPPDVTVGIVFAETEEDLSALIQPFVTGETQLATPPGIPFPIGATGQFPYGKQDDTDEGQLATAIGIDPKSGVIQIEFGKPVAWLSLPAVEARKLAAILIEKAEQLEKQMS